MNSKLNVSEQRSWDLILKANLAYILGIGLVEISLHQSNRRDLGQWFWARSTSSLIVFKSDSNTLFLSITRINIQDSSHVLCILADTHIQVKTLLQYWLNAGPPSATLAHH